MPEAVVAKCPGCQRNLRIPVEWIQRTMRCKFCGHTMKSQRKSSLPGQTQVPFVEELPDDRINANPSWGQSTQPPPIVGPLSDEESDSYSSRGNTSYTEGDHVPAFKAAQRHTGRGSYRGPKKGYGTIIAVSLAMILMTGLVVLILVKPDLFSKKDPDLSVVEKKVVPKEEIQLPKGVVSGPFPRRLLSINISNYVFVNPVSYGNSNFAEEKLRSDVHSVVTRIADKWQIPREQIFELTDGPTSEAPKQLRPAMESFPLKENIKKTIDLFCDSCRAQDRIVFLFTGHVIESEGQAFIVPLEGEFDQPELLIPLKEVYQKLGECKAQQKLIIWDVCRFNPDRGTERPSFGKMTESLEKILHTPPEGCLVITSCSKDEYAYEFDFIPNTASRSAGYGSLFLDEILHASAKGILSKTGKKNTGGIPSPDEPIPTKNLIDYLTESLPTFAKAATAGHSQTPKVSGTDSGDKQPYDSKEALAAKFEMPKAAKGADNKDVSMIFEELTIPTIKAVRKNLPQQKFAMVFPFKEEVMAKYKSDGVTFEKVMNNPEKYPFRAPIVEAVIEIRNLQQNKDDELPEEFRGATNDAVKKEVLNIQRTPARREAVLRELKAKLEAVEPMKEKETSLRWKAHYDFILAQVKLRLAYLSEYNLALGKVRRDELPPLEGKKDAGWKLAAVEKMKAPKEVRDLAEEGKNLLNELATAHPGTPWALAAKREKNLALGLEWQASAFESTP
jgi:hypothetical protein